MSFWKNLVSWAGNAAKSEIQQDGVKGAQLVAQTIEQQVTQHAPDMAAIINPLAQQIVSSMLSGVLSRTGQ